MELSTRRQQTAILQILFVFSGSLALTQAPQKFDVASVRRNLSGNEHDSGINISPGGRISGTNLTLKTLIWQAYGTTDFRITGGPGWLDSDRYDIEAKTENGQDIGLARLQPLLQSLLADRFRLKAHWETREATVYNLVVDKNGPKLKEDDAGPGRLMNSAYNRRQVVRHSCVAEVFPAWCRVRRKYDRIAAEDTMRTLFAICCVTVFAFAQQPRTAHAHSNTHITANKMTKNGEAIHLAGGIVIEDDSMLLQADAADANPTTGDITIHGDVHIHMKQAPENSK